VCVCVRLRACACVLACVRALVVGCSQVLVGRSSTSPHLAHTEPSTPLSISTAAVPVKGHRLPAAVELWDVPWDLKLVVSQPASQPASQRATHAIRHFVTPSLHHSLAPLTNHHHAYYYCCYCYCYCYCYYCHSDLLPPE
jgi:hypothetical protein